MCAIPKNWFKILGMLTSCRVNEDIREEYLQSTEQCRFPYSYVYMYDCIDGWIYLYDRQA